MSLTGYEYVKVDSGCAEIDKFQRQLDSFRREKRFEMAVDFMRDLILGNGAKALSEKPEEMARVAFALVDAMVAEATKK